MRTPGAWLDRLRRTRFAIWEALTEEVSRPDRLRAGGWLLQCAEEADLVCFVGNDLVPVDKWADDLRRVWNVVLRSNVRLLPTKEKPEPWTKPEIFRNGLRARFVSHWNRDHQKSIAESFKSPAFQNRHLKAANRLGEVALRVDDWTLRLVDALDADPSGGVKMRPRWRGAVRFTTATTSTPADNSTPIRVSITIQRTQPVAYLGSRTAPRLAMMEYTGCAFTPPTATAWTSSPMKPAPHGWLSTRVTSRAHSPPR